MHPSGSRADPTSSCPCGSCRAWSAGCSSPCLRRPLTQVVPKGLHRIRHYGLLANGNRADNIARVRELLAMAPRAKEPEEAKAADTDQPCVHPRPCPCCGGRMLIIETFAPGCE